MPEYLKRKLREFNGIDADDASQDGEILSYSKVELFDMICVWEGVGSGNQILEWVDDIFGIELPEV